MTDSIKHSNASGVRRKSFSLQLTAYSLRLTAYSLRFTAYSLLLTCFVFASIALAAPIDRAALIEDAVKAHYDSLLAGRAVEWKIEIRRCPQIKAENIELTRVRGEAGGNIPRGGRLCWVDVTADGLPRSLPVTLNIELVEVVPVAMQAIPPRTVLNDSLIKWLPLPTTGIGASAIPSPSELDECWTKVWVPEGSIITNRRISPVPTVVVGQELDIVASVGAVQAVAPGRALEDGRKGEKIRVESTITGKRLRAVVRSADRVELD